jgi:hypothetical protein
VRRLVGTHIGHELGALAVARDEVRLGEHRLGPRKRVERGDLDEQQSRHALDEELERVVDVVGHDAGRRRRRGRAGADVDAHALQHELRLVLGDGRLEREVARGEPHLLVASLVLEAGLVACVRFVEAAVEVHHRGSVDILDEQAAQIGHLAVPDHRSEPLDRADASERRDERLGHAFLEQVRRLRDVRVVLGPRR